MQCSKAWEELQCYLKELSDDLVQSVNVDKPNQSHFTLAQIKTLEQMKNLPALFAENLQKEVEIEESRLEYERTKPQ